MPAILNESAPVAGGTVTLKSPTLTSEPDRKAQKIKRRPPESVRSAWRITRSLVVFVAGALSVLAAWVAVEQWNRRPEVTLAWHRDAGNQALGLASQVEAEITPESLESKEVRVPIRIALQNSGNETAKSIRLEITYPADLTVLSEASRSIRPEGAAKVFRHDFGDLVPSRSFTPMTPTDVLVIPIEVSADAIVVVSKDKFPMNMVAIVAVLPPAEAGIVLGLSLFGDNIDPMDMRLTLNLPWVAPHFSLAEGEAEPQYAEVKSNDLLLLAEAQSTACTQAEWMRHLKPGGLVAYCSAVLDSNAAVQMISVDDLLRRVVVDEDGDGLVDFELWDKTEDGEPDQRIEWDEDVYFLEWEEPTD